MRVNLLVTFIICTFSSFAQGTISLSNAIQLALKNNLQLQIARNDAQIAHNNNHPGNAGMRPTVSLNASETPSLVSINQKYANGTTFQKDNVFNNNANANILAVFTLFDGNKMFATKHKLETLDIMGYNMLKSQVQQTISKVIISYSNIIRQKKFLEVVNQLNELGLQRQEIVKARQTAGLANNTDLFLAQLDIETVKQTVVSQEVLIKNAYTDLNILLNIKPDSIYEVEEFILKEKPLRRSDLDSMLKQNPELLMAQNQVEIAEQAQREIGAARLPLIRLTGAYNYNLSQSQAGFTLLNQSNGPQAGLTFTMPLFTGSVNSRNYTNAKLNVQSSEWRRELTLQTLQGSYIQAWQNYTAALSQLQSDSAAIETAKKYIDLMQQRFTAGQNTILELKESQRSFEDTYYRFISNQYIAKLAETQLLGLTGQLTN